MENVWSEIARKVYENGKQFNTVDELGHAIIKNWNKLSVFYVKKLYRSMQKRCIDVIAKGGRKTGY